jgi:acyl dehydratase
VKHLDTSDLDLYVGKAIGGGQLKDTIAVNDIRRWVQGMQNPHPLFFDEAFAAESRFGRIVAPQSFTVCTSDSHGAGPSIQGRLPGSHMLFGGDEWWFAGPRIFPGDQIRLERTFVGYEVKETQFAGPTVFANGDTVYINQHGETVAKQRCTSIRYLVDEANKRKKEADSAEPTWVPDALREIEAERRAYMKAVLELGHARREGVKVGDRLPTRKIGPHSVLTFATEYRAFLMSVWGSFKTDELPNALRQAGWLPEMDKDMEAAKIDPSESDGLYKGSSRGHAQPEYAKKIGIARGYGYGASMGAWMLDTLQHWAGEHGEIVHARLRYRAPALTGDLSVISGSVESVGPEVGVRLEMKNQHGDVIATGTAELRL